MGREAFVASPSCPVRMLYVGAEARVSIMFHVAGTAGRASSGTRADWLVKSVTPFLHADPRLAPRDGMPPAARLRLAQIKLLAPQ